MRDVLSPLVAVDVCLCRCFQLSVCACASGLWGGLSRDLIARALSILSDDGDVDDRERTAIL